MPSVFFAKSLRIFCAEAAGPRRAPARSRVPAKAYFLKGSDDGALTTPRQVRGEGCGVVTCGRRPIGKMLMKKPAADFSARALEDCCDDDAMPVICPTCQIV
jgi:hypothetical protein